MTDEQMTELVRNLLGGLLPEEMPETMILFFWTKWKASYDTDKNPKKLPIALYNTVVDCVRWLIAQEVSSGNSSVTQRLEKVGDETISITGGSSLASWKDFLNWLEENPDYIDPSLKHNTSLVIVGGVRKDEFNRVKNNPNSSNGFMEQGVYPSRGVPTHTSCNPGSRRNPWLRR